MKDFLGNELHIGDKVVFPAAYTDTKRLDYGIVKGFSKTDKTAYCKSIVASNWDGSILRQTKQIVKIG